MPTLAEAGRSVYQCASKEADIPSLPDILNVGKMELPSDRVQGNCLRDLRYSLMGVREEDPSLLDAWERAYPDSVVGSLGPQIKLVLDTVLSDKEEPQVAPHHWQEYTIFVRR